MSSGSRGRPFTYPESLIRLLLHLPYRQLEGFTRDLPKYVEGLAALDYTTLNRKGNRLNISMDEEGLHIQPAHLFLEYSNAQKLDT